MSSCTASESELPPQHCTFYCQALQALQAAQVPFLVGGAYAFASYVGITRDTRDFDIFVLPHDCTRALEVLQAAGYHTELTFPHWLGKAMSGNECIDVIFSSGNGVARVDEAWFTYATVSEVLGMSVRLCPPEEMLWSKAYVMERERYDGADIIHLLRACGERLDWLRLLRRFGPHWRVLLSHLILFGFVYPAEQAQIPHWVMEELLERLQGSIYHPPAPDGLCYGPLLSRAQYLTDIDCWGYGDARLASPPYMTAEDVTHWTAAIDKEKGTG
jgi:hypothetical protein